MVGMRRWVRLASVMLLSGGALVSMAWAQPEETKKKPAPTPAQLELPAVLSKPAPENVEDLRALERHVQKVVEKVMPAIVGIQIGQGQGSGVIVKEDGTILTAGHVSGAPKKDGKIVLTTKKLMNAKTLGRYTTIDSGMMKIAGDEGVKYPFAEMGKSSELKPGQWVIAIGHPGGYRPNRTPVVRLGRVLFANQFMIRTDCTLVGGDSGGPLFDMHGRVVGIHSRIGGLAITENVHVPIDTYHQTWARLARGDSWGGQIGQPEIVKSAGGKVVFEKKDKLTKQDPTDSLQVDCHRKVYTFNMKAGSTYTLDLISGDRTGKALDVFLRLEGPDGKDLAQDDDGGGFPHARIVHKAMQDGDYRVIATSFEPRQTGNFTLKISEAEFRDFFVSGNVDVLKAIRIPPPALTPLIEKFRQVKVPLHINAVLIDEKNQPIVGKAITLQWEKGTEKLKTNEEGVIRWPLVKDKTKNLNMQLPMGTRAMLAVTDANGNGIDLPNGKDDPSSEKVPSAGGNIVKTIEGKLLKSDPFDFEREKCYRHVHEFKMQPGKTYTIDLISDDFDSYLRLEDADRNKIAEDDDGAGNCNARIVHTPKSEEVYRIVVTTCDAGQHGAYRVVIREIAAKVEKK